MTDNVVFLAHRNQTPTATHEVLVCGTCHNKSWVAEYLADSQFPRLRCCVCGDPAGLFGWVDDEDENA